MAEFAIFVWGASMTFGGTGTLLTQLDGFATLCPCNNFKIKIWRRVSLKISLCSRVLSRTGAFMLAVCKFGTFDGFCLGVLALTSCLLEGGRGL